LEYTAIIHRVIESLQASYPVAKFDRSVPEFRSDPKNISDSSGGSPHCKNHLGNYRALVQGSSPL